MSMIPSIAVSDVALDRLDTPLLVVAVGKDALDIVGELASVDTATNGALGRAIERRDFRGGRDETLMLGGSATGIQRVLLVGTGPTPAGDANSQERVIQVRRAATLAGRQASKLGVGSVSFYGATNETTAEAVTLGLCAGAWDFREMKSAVPEAD